MYYNNFQRVYIISILKRKDYRTMLKLLAKDSNAMFVLTSGNDEDRYALKEDLFECMKEFVDIDRISKKELRDAISDAMKSQDNTVNLVVGSFYAYSTVVDEIEKNQNARKFYEKMGGNLLSDEKYFEKEGKKYKEVGYVYNIKR